MLRDCARAALGFLLHVVFSRVHPFQAETTNDLLDMHLEGSAPSLAERRPDLPAAVVELVDGLTRRNPDERFDSAQDALRFLERRLDTKAFATAARPLLAPEGLLHRDSDFLRIEECFCAASAGTLCPPCVVVQGPGGIGKTRVVREMRGVVQMWGGAYIEISTSRVTSDLTPVADAVVSGLQTSGEFEKWKLMKQLWPQSRSQVHAADVGPRLERLLVKCTSDTPLLLHFDDFQDAPAQLCKFVVDLLRAIGSILKGGEDAPRLLIVLSVRTDGAQAAKGLANVLTINLEPLADDEARSFVKTLFGQDSVPTWVLDEVVGQADGNPARLLDAARELTETSGVTRDCFQWRFPPQRQEAR